MKNSQEKKATFYVTVKDIKQKTLPKLDDEFAKDLGEAQTLDELKNQIRNNLEEARVEDRKEKLRESLIEKLVSLYKFSVPPSMIERQTVYLQEETANRQKALGRTEIEQKPISEYRELAEKQIKLDIILNRVAENSNVEVVMEDYQDYYQKLAKRTGQDPINIGQYYERPEQKEALTNFLKREKTLDFILESANIKKKTKGKKKGE